MNKKYIFIGIIVILVIVAFIYCLVNRTIKLSDNKYFKDVYTSQNDIDNLVIDVIDDRSENIVSTITDKKDISYIINSIKDEKINPNVGLGETLLGGAYKLKIKNKTNNNKVDIIINNTEVTINNKTYTTKSNLKNKITDVYLKYYIIK
ncbi:MAG: hypothetical protein RSE41_04675 [Clostridia bacterium]